MKVSIIIPCYNSEKWIDQCLRSALDQSYKDTEVILVDNESTDNSPTVVKEIAKEYEGLILSSAPNIHPNCWDEAREVGMKLATGDYILTMGSDDFLAPSFVENCSKFINIVENYNEEHNITEKVLAIQSPILGVSNETPHDGRIQKHFYNSIESFKEQCLVHCPVNTPSVLFHKSLFDEGMLSTMPEKYGGAADYDLYCRLADKGVFIYPCSDWLGYHYRWHKDQATWSVLSESVDYNSEIQGYWRGKWRAATA